ncbi:MAG TPA: hypothetical protein VM470_01370 [Acidimicrobiia bacterium]|nr:hypothetical protein [Acidimicrobiia bacterium]
MPHCCAKMAYPDFSSVLFTRGGGCEELAGLLSDTAQRVSGDLAEFCVEQRADLLITKRPPGGFGLVSVAIPVDFVPDQIGRVVAAVSGGPHSGLVARLAGVLSGRLGVPAAVASAFFSDEDKSEAEAAVDRFADHLTDADRMIVAAEDPSGFVSQLPERSLVVMGEPGGSFLARIFFGAGARLRAAVPAGAVVVRHAEARVFHVMDEPVFVGPLHHAGDTLRLHHHPLMAVVENGMLVGMVRRNALEQANSEAPVGELMESARYVSISDAAAEAIAVGESIRPGPIPVIDQSGRLVGALHIPGLS